MNFLKKKLKPLTSGLTTASSASNSHNRQNKDLEDDLYDEYVVEAPPHPSELLALGIDPSEIDANDPEKLRELYRKAKEEGKDKKTNSVLLARQRQREEIEEKKKTREEWKFFDSLTARVEQAVKDSQKTLEHLKESSAIEKLTEPDYELRLSADEVFKSSKSVKQEKGPNNWIDFDEEDSDRKTESIKEGQCAESNQSELVSGCDEVDEFGCARRKSSIVAPPEHIAKELLEDFGFDLRPKSREKSPITDNQEKPNEPISVKQESKLDIDLKVAARPRPRPNGNANKEQEQEVDPFDTSFVASPIEKDFLEGDSRVIATEQNIEAPVKAIDPFDTSFVNF